MWQVKSAEPPKSHRDPSSARRDPWSVGSPACIASDSAGVRGRDAAGPQDASKRKQIQRMKRTIDAASLRWPVERAFRMLPAPMQRAVVFAVLLAALPASAQQLAGGITRAGSLDVRVAGRTPEERALAFLTRHRGELAIAPGATLRFDRTIVAHGLTNVRFVRTAHGGDVTGSSIVVRMRGDVVDYVSVSRADALPAIGARAIARDGEAIAYPVGGALVPAWQIDTAGLHLHQRDRTIVDARDGRVLAHYSRMLDALGRVYSRDPISDAGVTTDVELRFLTSRELLTGRYFRAANCNASDRGCQAAQLAVADPTTGDFLYDPVEPSFSDAFAEVHAYHHASAIAEYFRTVHGFTWRCGDDPLMRLFVNYTELPNTPYDNAMYAPSASTECGYMLFGQGETRDFAYDASVVYHENTHSIVDEVAGLEGFLDSDTGVSFEPGGLNEGFADYFAASFSGDSVIGEYFMGIEGAEAGGLRDVANAYACPNDLTGEVHFDGRVWGGLGWDLRTALGAEKADALMFATLAALSAAPSLAEAGDTLIATADVLAAMGTLTSEDAARAAELVRARGLVGCERIVPLDGARTGYSGVPGITGQRAGLAPIQYRIDVPADALSLTLSIRSLGRVTGRYRLYARAGEPVSFSAEAGLQATLEPEAGVAIARADLPRCDALYIAVVQTDLDSVGPSLFELDAELETSGLTEACTDPDAGSDAGSMDPDAGMSPSDAGGGVSGGACGCVAAHDSAPGWLAIVLPFALASVRRRRP